MYPEYPGYTAWCCPSPRALKVSCNPAMSHVTLSRSSAIFSALSLDLWDTESSKCSEALPEGYFIVSLFIPVRFLAVYFSWVRQCLCYGCGRGGFGGWMIDWFHLGWCYPRWEKQFLKHFSQCFSSRDYPWSDCFSWQLIRIVYFCEITNYCLFFSSDHPLLHHIWLQTSVVYIITKALLGKWST